MDKSGLPFSSRREPHLGYDLLFTRLSFCFNLESKFPTACGESTKCVSWLGNLASIFCGSHRPWDCEGLGGAYLRPGGGNLDNIWTTAGCLNGRLDFFHYKLYHSII